MFKIQNCLEYLDFEFGICLGFRRARQSYALASRVGA